MRKTLLAVFILASIVLGQDEAEAPSSGGEGDHPTEQSPSDVTETETELGVIDTELPADHLATTLLPDFTLETIPDTTFETTTSAPSTTTTTVSTTSTTTVTTTATTATTTTTITTTIATTTSGEETTTLLFEATVDEVVVEEEGQEFEKEEEGGVKEVKDEKTEVSTKTAGAPVWVGWVVAILCVSLLFAACIIYIRQARPKAWRSISARLPISSRVYQVSAAGCCLPGPGSRPSRDTCFLCLQQVPARQWDAHRRQCALENRDKLEHLSSPSPVRCFRCNSFLRALPVYPVTVFLCDNPGACTSRGRELDTNSSNRYNCYFCDFDLCSDCVAGILTRGERGGDGGGEGENTTRRKVVRRTYPRREATTQTNDENEQPSHAADDSTDSKAIGQTGAAPSPALGPRLTHQPPPSQNASPPQVTQGATCLPALPSH